jgi:hypothetical protein
MRKTESRFGFSYSTTELSEVLTTVHQVIRSGPETTEAAIVSVKSTNVGHNVNVGLYHNFYLRVSVVVMYMISQR